MPENDGEVYLEPLPAREGLSEDRRIILASESSVPSDVSQIRLAREQASETAPREEAEDPQIASYLATLSLFGNQMLLELMEQRLDANKGKAPKASYQRAWESVRAVVASYDEKLSFPSGYSQMVAKYGEVVLSCSNYIRESEKNGVKGEEEAGRLKQIARTSQIAQQEIEILRKRYKPPEEGQEPPSLRELFIEEGHKELLNYQQEEEVREVGTNAEAGMAEAVQAGENASAETGNPFLRTDGTLASEEKTLTDRIAALGEKEICSAALPKVLKWLNRYHAMWDGRRDISPERDRLENTIILAAKKAQGSKAMTELAEAIQTSAARRNMGALDLPAAEAFQEAAGPGLSEEKKSLLCDFLKKYHEISESDTAGRKKIIESILAALEGNENDAMAEYLGEICREKIGSRRAEVD